MQGKAPCHQASSNPIQGYILPFGMGTLPGASKVISVPLLAEEHLHLMAKRI